MTRGALQKERSPGMPVKAPRLSK